MKILISFLLILLSLSLGAAIEDHTYRLSLSRDGSNSCLVPLVDTEKGVFTAAHCIQGHVDRGQKEFYGINEKGNVKKFSLKKYKYVKRGLDYVLLTDGDKDGVPIGNSKVLNKGDVVTVYSPKLGLVQRRLNAQMDGRTNKFYIESNREDCGCSGSGVYKEGRLVGILVARTGPGDGVHDSSVILRIESILGDLNGKH